MQNFNVKTSLDTEKKACAQLKDYFYEMVAEDEKCTEVT